MSRILFLIFLIVGICHGAITVSFTLDCKVAKEITAAVSGLTQNSTSNPQARCYDSRIASFLNSGLSYYAHDMGALSKYILDQITRARYPGYWFIHAQMIQNQHQGIEWQSTTNGDLFTPTSTRGCVYHDTQTYIVILKY